MKYQPTKVIPKWKQSKIPIWETYPGAPYMAIQIYASGRQTHCAQRVHTELKLSTCINFRVKYRRIFYIVTDQQFDAPGYKIYKCQVRQVGGQVIQISYNYFLLNIFLSKYNKFSSSRKVYNSCFFFSFMLLSLNLFSHWGHGISLPSCTRFLWSLSDLLFPE